MGEIKVKGQTGRYPQRRKVLTVSEKNSKNDVRERILRSER